MIYWFVYTVFFLINILIFIYMRKAFLMKNRMGMLMMCSFISSDIILWAYAVNYMSKSSSVMEVSTSIAHAFIDIAIYFFALFIFELEEKKIKIANAVISASIVVADVILVLTNPISHFYSNYIIKHTKYSSFAMFDMKRMFAIHVVIVFLLLYTIISSLVRSSIKSPSYYRARYLSILTLFVIIIVLNVIFTFDRKLTFDYSLFGYVLAQVIVYYVAFEYAPQKFLRTLQNYVDDTITDATLIFDYKGMPIKVNERAMTILGFELITSKPFIDSHFGLHSEEGNEGCVTVNHDERVYELKYNNIFDKKGRAYASVYIFHDVTESTRQLGREHNAAIYDKLTSCFNRLGFFEKAPEFFASNKVTGGYAVVVSGINDFKGINGLYGTTAGDTVLKTIAKRFYELHNEMPMLYARTAEGKFSCIVPFENVDEVVNRTSRINIMIDEEVEIHVEMCHGFAVMNDMEKPADYYYELALLALARCKSMAACPVLEYSKDMAEEQRRKQLIIGAMHDAIEKGQFFVELQPQIDIKNNKVVGAEALVRWEHPTLGILYPRDFIPLFENNGYIAKLDKFVWREAARLLKKLDLEYSYEGTISVNVSQVDIMCMDIVEVFKEIVAEEKIDAKRLHVEITESACVNNRSLLILALSRLREMGFIVEIDDFGSGYSSLNALMHIPFDIVKLDMLFLREPNEKSYVIMKSISNMIHDLKAKIVVEGVETISNLEIAHFFNSDAAQGYYYSQPISVDEFVKYIKTYNV